MAASRKVRNYYLHFTDTVRVRGRLREEGSTQLPKSLGGVVCTVLLKFES